MGAKLRQAPNAVRAGRARNQNRDIWATATANAFHDTDKRPDGKVWDVYSDIPGGTPPYEFVFGPLGSGSSEGIAYNREHSFPQSWFGGSVSPMYSDLWIIYPTDSKVNSERGNFPYGMAGSATFTSLNGSKLGGCVSPGYSGTCFEPIDGYKGDLARSQFYVATRYFDEDASWPGGSGRCCARFQASRKLIP